MARRYLTAKNADLGSLSPNFESLCVALDCMSPAKVMSRNTISGVLRLRNKSEIAAAPGSGANSCEPNDGSVR